MKNFLKFKDLHDEAIEMKTWTPSSGAMSYITDCKYISIGVTIFDVYSWCHDIQHDNTQHIGIHHKITWHGGLICDTQHNNIEHK